MKDAPHPFAARLGAWPDPRMLPILDRRVSGQFAYFHAQVRMDLAHTLMLREVGVLSGADCAAIIGILLDIEAGGPSRLHNPGGRSSLFWLVEARLIDTLGEAVGGRMHTGRSHNDIMPTVSRMTARSRLLDLLEGLTKLQGALIARAGEHGDTVMPGYTALQQSQPWTFGHYLVGWSYAFARDVDRLLAAFRNTNRSPLGASALAGSAWPLNRQRTADLLGFDSVIAHSRDAGFATRDYVAETIAGISIAMSNVSSLSSDLFLWSTSEFEMVELADGFSGTSSLMPQKKNAWAVDWARGAAGAVVGSFASTLAALRGASSTDGAYQDYPEKPLAEAFDVSIEYVELLAGVIESLVVHDDVMLRKAATGWATASNLADTIVRRSNLSFRVAHAVVGRLVRDMSALGRLPTAITSEDVDRASVEVGTEPLQLDDSEVAAALDPTAFVRSRVTLGSVHPDETEQLIRRAETVLAEAIAHIGEARKHLVEADAELLKLATAAMDADG